MQHVNVTRVAREQGAAPAEHTRAGGRQPEARRTATNNGVAQESAQSRPATKKNGNTVREHTLEPPIRTPTPLPPPPAL